MPNSSSKPRPVFDLDKLSKDMALRGWNQSDLARAAGVAPMSISRFFAGNQTAKIAQKCALALGHPVRRYFVRIERAR